MKICGNVYTDTGQRPVNEDAVLFSVVRIGKKRLVLAALCDGIGGLSEGDLAAGYICRRLNEVLYSKLIPALCRRTPFLKIGSRIKDSLYRISGELKEYADHKGIKLGSTLSLLLIYGKRYMILNVGDSRVYKIKDKDKVKIMTVPDQNPDGSVSRCIGSFPFYDPYAVRGFIVKKTGFLLCSDGFYKRMDKDVYILCPSKISDESSVEKRLYEIGKLVRKRHEGDNATAVYIKAG